jgi:Fic family protein
VLQAIPNADVLLSPLTSQEAVLSSRIEGTQATLGEVLAFEAQGLAVNEASEKGNDIQEVLNYRKDLKEANRLLDSLPLSQRLFKQVHGFLLEGVRGRHKSPGLYRQVPNWIGAPGCLVEEARFVTCGVEQLNSAMATWETYMHTDAPDSLFSLPCSMLSLRQSTRFLMVMGV